MFFNFYFKWLNDHETAIVNGTSKAEGKGKAKSDPNDPVKRWKANPFY